MKANETTFAQESIWKRIVEKKDCCQTELFQFHNSDDYSDHSDYSDYSDYCDYGDSISYSIM